MSKIRVHELAKQLGRPSKDIINLLSESNEKIQSHMSTLSDQQVEIVNKTFAKSGTPAAAPAAQAPEKKEGKQQEPKKSNITQVYNPQNSRANFNNKKSGNTNQRQNNNRPGQGQNQGNQNRSNTQNQGSQNRPSTQYQNQGSQNRPNTQNQGNQSRPTTQYQNQGSQNRPNTQNQGNQNRQNSQYQNQGGQNRPNTQNQGNQNRPTTQNQGNQNRPTTQNQGNQNRPNTQYQNQGNQNRQNNQNQNQGNQNRPNNQNQRNQSRPNNQNQNQNQGSQNRPNAQNQTTGRRPNQNRPNQGRRNMKGNQNQRQEQPAPVVKEEVIKTLILPEVLTIKELAEKMKMPAAALVKKLFLKGTMVTVNQEIDYEAAEEIALEFNFISEPEEKIDVIEELLREEEEDESKLVSRPPVVCVMGHVDHGKTSLLDAIRKTNHTTQEAGGITQHIGAYVVTWEGEKITFLDTPGHEAFTAMRMRGASSTDIAILVVAADDGVMPQTVEAINHAKAAGIEIIVAINKIDKPSANIDKVKQELAEHQLIPEDWGGSTIFVPVSAHTQEGIGQLLEMILLTAEVGELKANPKRKGRGLVIEAELDKGKGSVATILVQKGTLRVGDSIAVGSCYGKVRAMMDDKGRRVKEAGPSTPVEILGLNDVPNAGETFVVTENDKEARAFAETYISEGREKLLEDTKAKLSLDDLFSQIQAGNVKELGIIVKADVQGSVEAVKQSLEKLSNEEVVVKIIHGGVGAINESDVILASASNAIIIGFNVRPDVMAKSVAEREKVDLRLYRVIYNAIEDVEAAMKGMLDPIFEEKVLGHAEVRQTFKASGIGTIAGSYVLDGIFQKGCSVRITRGKDLIFEGPLASLKRFKDDVKEVKTGYECGLVFEKFNDIKEGDLVEAYTMVEVPR